MSFSKVEDGNIIASGIEKGSVYNGKKYGLLDPDSVYIASDLLPEVGEEPSFNPETQTCSGPTFEIAGDQVNRTWTILNKDLNVVRRELRAKSEEFKKTTKLESKLTSLKNTNSFIDNCDADTIKEIIKILVKRSF